jgi:RNA recognition motif-containing protein
LSPDSFYDRFNAPQNNVLAVFGLDRRANEQDLFDVYRKYGCKECKIIMDKYTGNPKGYGFVYFMRVEDASKARQKTDGTLLLSKNIRVDFSIGERDFAPHLPTTTLTTQEIQQKQLLSSENYYNTSSFSSMNNNSNSTREPREKDASRSYYGIINKERSSTHLQIDTLHHSRTSYGNHHHNQLDLDRISDYRDYSPSPPPPLSNQKGDPRDQRPLRSARDWSRSRSPQRPSSRQSHNYPPKNNNNSDLTHNHSHNSNSHKINLIVNYSENGRLIDKQEMNGYASTTTTTKRQRDSDIVEIRHHHQQITSNLVSKNFGPSLSPRFRSPSRSLTPPIYLYHNRHQHQAHISLVNKRETIRGEGFHQKSYYERSASRSRSRTPPRFRRRSPELNPRTMNSRRY